MEPVYGVVAGIDVHKKVLMVVVSRVGEPERQYRQRRFGTTTYALKELAEWLAGEQVTVVAMESTAEYWKPVWLALEGQFGLVLAQARSNPAPRGRKSDFADARRIVRRLLANDLTLSFVPDAEQRRWRLLTRTRVRLGEQILRLRNQLEGILEEGQIKLSCLVSDLLGVSSRRMLQALAAGESDPQKLAGLKDERLRASEEELEAALSGKLHEIHRLLLGQKLEQIELLEKQIRELDDEVRRAMAAHQEAIVRLCELPGMAVNSSEQAVAELGPEAATFDSPAQVASWVGVCPGREESAEESHSNRSPKGNRPLRRVLNQAAWAAVRTKGSYFEALFRRLVPKLGVKKAIWAVAHRLLRLIWKILHDKVRYREHGAIPQDPRLLERRKNRLVRELGKMGYRVHVVETTDAVAG